MEYQNYQINTNKEQPYIIFSRSSLKGPRAVRELTSAMITFFFPYLYNLYIHSFIKKRRSDLNFLCSHIFDERLEGQGDSVYFSYSYRHSLFVIR